VSVIGIGRDGKSLSPSNLRGQLELEGDVEVPSGDWIQYLLKLDPETVVVFPVLHGPQGEDGTVQGMLEVFGLPYVGAGVGSSAVGMNKIYCKSILKAAGHPVLPWLSVSRGDWSQSAASVAESAERDLTYPLFVKPANMGSSVGINKCNDREELLHHLATAFRYDDYVLVEVGVDAREVEVSVLGSFEPRASIPGEIVPVDEFYSYEAKYLKEGSRLLIPAPLDRVTVDRLRSLAIDTFQALQLEGMARVDFLIEKSSGAIWINEPNTIPGFTQISMYPKLWEASGLGYSELLEELVVIGLARHRRRAQFSVNR
jgi:D-alanine-D-alanine ligase